MSVGPAGGRLADADGKVNARIGRPHAIGRGLPSPDNRTPHCLLLCHADERDECSTSSRGAGCSTSTPKACRTRSPPARSSAYMRVRPDGHAACTSAPRPGHGAGAPAARRAPAGRARGRRHGHDRRSERQDAPSGSSSLAEQVDGERARHSRAARALPRLRGPERGAACATTPTWLTPLRLVEFLRDVGKHFTVNYMLQKDSVQSRMDAGISFTEFSYMLLQAYDFLELHRRDGVTLQLGGSDQWGNITAGIELIRRIDGAEAHALTLPLVTTSSGDEVREDARRARCGSTRTRTSPYEFYQFWMGDGRRATSGATCATSRCCRARRSRRSTRRRRPSAGAARGAAGARARRDDARARRRGARGCRAGVDVLLRRPRGDGAERRRARRAARGGAVRRSDARHADERDGSGAVRRAQAARRVGARGVERRGEAAARAGGRVGEQAQAGRRPTDTSPRATCCSAAGTSSSARGSATTRCFA